MGRKPPPPGMCEAWCSAVPFTRACGSARTALLMGHQPWPAWVARPIITAKLTVEAGTAEGS
jgi:hypothetical protein